MDEIQWSITATYIIITNGRNDGIMKYEPLHEKT